MGKRRNYEERLMACMGETIKFFNLLHRLGLINDVQYECLYGILIDASKKLEEKEWKK